VSSSLDFPFWIKSFRLGLVALFTAWIAEAAGAAAFVASPAHGPQQFAAFPATPYPELEPDVRERYWDAEQADGCGPRIDVLIDAYVEKYPRFTRFRNDPAWRQAWLRGVGLSTYIVEVRCHFADPLLTRMVRAPLHWLDLDSGLPVWCGRWSRREADPELRELIAEMIPLAMRHEMPGLVDRFIAATRQHRTIGIDAFVALNPDVALYLVERRKRQVDAGLPLPAFTFEDTETSDGLYLGSLPPKRRAAVMAAVEIGDYRSVLETTAACEPREDFLKSVGAGER